MSLPGFGMKSAKKVGWFFPELVFEQESNKNKISDRNNDNQPLFQRYFLDGLPCLFITNLARAILCPIPVNKRIELTSQADAERRLKEQKYQADETYDTSQRTVGIDYYH